MMHCISYRVVLRLGTNASYYDVESELCRELDHNFVVFYFVGFLGNGGVDDGLVHGDGILFTPTKVVGKM